MHDDDFRLQFGGELAKLKELGISESQIDGLQIVFLPENVFTFRDRSELHDAGDSLALAKALKQEGVRCATAYDLGLDIPVLERRSRDRWLGTVWIRDHLAVAFLVGVLSSLVATGISDAVLKPKVHAEVYIQRDANVTKLSFHGDGETLVKMLNALKDQ